MYDNLMHCTNVRMCYICIVDTRTKILNKTRILYNKKGMQNVTARVISQSLNVSLGSFSYHFPDKRIIVKSLYHNLQMELQNMYSSMRNEPASITTYLETHKQLFKIQSKYKFFYLNLFEILLNNEELKEDFSSRQSKSRSHIDREISQVIKLKKLILH